MSNKIIGIGNAIVDILCKVDESFLKSQNLVKGSMSLIDDKKAQELSKLPLTHVAPGGSVANTMSALGMLSCDSYFIGKVGTDNFGKRFIEDTEQTGVKFIGENSYNQASAKSFVMITPDAHRTMCTYLGCASRINERDIDDSVFKGANTLYLEGYLWDDPETIQALRKSITMAKKRGVKIAFSLSDPFCVSRHKQDFIDLVLGDLDILFANELEALELISATEYSNDRFFEFFSQNPDLIAVITRSEKGCTVFGYGSVMDVPTEKVDEVLDTTGAGDAFAAGFLYGIVNDFDLEKSANYGNRLAAQIIQQVGARFTKEQIKQVKL